MLVATGLACLAGNLHFTSRRTLIPQALDARLEHRERRTEKHRGLDDVVLWHFDGGHVVQVTDVVDELVPRGARVTKDAWERTLRVDGEARPLTWSDDVVGMARVAGPSALALLGLAWAVVRRRGRRGHDARPGARRASRRSL